MARKMQKSFEKVAEELGRYPAEAYVFLLEGLDFTVRKIHGQLDPRLQKLIEVLVGAGIDPADVERLGEEGELPNKAVSLIRQFDNWEDIRGKLNRHVNGDDLCRGLCQCALNRWGLMSVSVLRHWKIRTTKDFGRMVFALIESGNLQKRPEDSLADFENVYDFEEAFARSYVIGRTQQESEAESESEPEPETE